ncbi:MAG TPA: hypothetical protein VHO48_11835 [Anaerolineaceae bacterium]|nr:hypothetical protein [Anaerolineaceae bacterium]
MDITQVTTRSRASDRAVFIVWSAPTHGSSRSRLLAKALQIEDLHYLYSTAKGGPFSAPLRYLLQGAQTLRLLFQKRPVTVFVQSPPSYAVFFVAIYCALTRARYIIDAHSDALQRGIWTRPRWLWKRINRGAIVTLVTDDYFRAQLERSGAKAMVLRDPVASAPLVPSTRESGFQVTVVNTFSRDEPLHEVLHAAAGLPEVHFYVTGKRSRADPRLLDEAPKNVIFTDFLSSEAYNQLLASSHAVMSLTTRDHTLQCGACEALSLKVPIITSDWPLLRDYFSLGTVHVDNSAEGILAGIQSLRNAYERYTTEIGELHAIRYAEWQQHVAGLQALVTPAGQ